MIDQQAKFIAVVKELLKLKDAGLASKTDGETMELDIAGLDLDSLEKMELIMKIEDTFKIMLNEGEVLKCGKICHLFELVKGEH